MAVNFKSKRGNAAATAQRQRRRHKAIPLRIYGKPTLAEGTRCIPYHSCISTEDSYHHSSNESTTINRGKCCRSDGCKSSYKRRIYPAEFHRDIREVQEYLQ